MKWTISSFKHKLTSLASLVLIFCLLAIAAPAYALDPDTDLSAADASFLGEDAFDRPGWSVAPAGDVNGDGYDDILIGASGDDDGGNSAGQTYLILGKTTGWAMDTDLSAADASFWGEDTYDYSGWSVAPAGDVNGDGYDDILIGAYQDDDGGSDAGQTYLILGTVPPAPEMSIEGNAVEIADGDGSPSAGDHTDFGSANITTGTVVRTFTIKNTGSGGLTLSGDPKVAIGGTHAGDFTVTTQPATPVAATTGQTTFQVTFDPSSTGNRTATLSIANNDSDENPYDFSIQGTGTGTAVLTVSGITADNREYDFTTTATLDTSGAALVGVADGDSVDLGVSSATGAFADATLGTGKTVTVSNLTISGVNAANYSLTQPTTTADITARAITVTAVTDTKAYDGTTASSGTPTLTSGSLVGDVAGSWTQTFDTKEIATSKTLTPAGTVNDGNSGNNYDVTFATVDTGTITQKALTVSGITASNKVYDGTTTVTLDTSGAALVGVADGDSVDLDVSSAAGVFADANAGTGKTVTVSNLTISGVNAANYSLTQPTTTADITASGGGGGGGFITPAPPTMTPETLEQLSADDAAEAVEELAVEEAADIIEEVATETAAAIIEEVATETAAAIIEEMATETAVAIMEELPTGTLTEIIPEMSEEALIDTLPGLSPDTLYSVGPEILFDSLPNAPTEQLACPHKGYHFLC